MEFCAECGSRFVPKKVNSGEQALVMLACTKCQFKKKESDLKALAKSRVFDQSPKQFVAVIGKEEQLTVLPTMHVACLRCGIERLTFGKFRPEDQKNLQPSFSDASDAATLTVNAPKTAWHAEFFFRVFHCFKDSKH